MKEILDSPAVMLLCIANVAPGTAAATSSSNTLDTRNAIGVGTGGGLIGNARHVTLLCQTGVASTNKSVLYTLSHAASVTDAATNGTTLATITRAASVATDKTDRFEIDMLGLQPVLKLTALPSTGGTSESVIVAATALLSRQEQTPIASTMLASGTVVIYAAGATQSSTAA